MSLYLRPESLHDALAALGRQPLTVLAGGTDFYPARVGRPVNESLLDISALAPLRGIVETSDHWRLGAATTWTDVIEAPLPPLFQALRQAAREVGGVQIQNAGTLGGNLCNASPAADGVPVLLALDASVELASRAGTRTLPLAAFITGPRRTARAADELLTAVLIPRPGGAALSGFAKLGARRYLVISIVMAAACLEWDATGRVRAARVAVGACAPLARRLPALETALAGCPLGLGLGEAVSESQLAPLSPIDDVRAEAAYRLDAAGTLLRRLLADLGAEAAAR
jgi:CO/xanthine dehydrogenase FAD-binding subunit